MNTHDPYIRETEPTPVADAASSAAPAAAPAAAEPNDLAVHGDPSVRRSSPATRSLEGERALAWVRPSDLPAMLGSDAVRRGINRQAETSRQLRRLPARVSRSTIARPTPETGIQNDGGLSL